MKKLKEQRGAALVVGLVLLLVATTLGVAALTSTVTEERIAGNQKQISEAFMAAETGIARRSNGSKRKSTAHRTIATPLSGTSLRIVRLSQRKFMH
jgi:Tfp pilus assembly protein PilX